MQEESQQAATTRGTKLACGLWEGTAGLSNVLYSFEFTATSTFNFLGS